MLNNVIFNPKSADDAEIVRYGNTPKRWREPILNHFDKPPLLWLEKRAGCVSPLLWVFCQGHISFCLYLPLRV